MPKDPCYSKSMSLHVACMAGGARLLQFDTYGHRKQGCSRCSRLSERGIIPAPLKRQHLVLVPFLCPAPAPLQLNCYFWSLTVALCWESYLCHAIPSISFFLRYLIFLLNAARFRTSQSEGYLFFQYSIPSLGQIQSLLSLKGDFKMYFGSAHIALE